MEVQSRWEITLGKEHPKYATVLNNLAILYLKMGRYARTESLHLEAKSIREKALGKEHPYYANTINNLANLYSKMGNRERAKQLFLEARDIREKTVGKEHPDYADVLHNLSVIYAKEGEMEKAISLANDAKDIWEKTMGKENNYYASALTSLAGRYQELGLYEKSEPIFLECLSLREKVLGKEHPAYASSLTNLGVLYTKMGLYEKAGPFYLEAKEIIEKAVGKLHPDYGAALRRLMGHYVEGGLTTKAEPLLLELSVVNKNLMERALQHLSEEELNNYLNTFSENQNQALSLAYLTDSQKITPTCFDNSLFYKGFLLNATTQIKRLAISDSTTAKKLNHLKGYRRRLANLYILPVAERDSTVVADLESQTNDLEKDLTRTVAGYGEAMRQVRWQEVQAALQPGEAALEFVHYRFYEKKATDSTLYAALVLRHGQTTPSFVPLFEQSLLDSLLSQYGQHKFDYINNLYTVTNEDTPHPKKSLYELLWQPLEKELGDLQKIYFSPSGLLHQLNHGAIPINGEEFLSDRYQLVRLNSTRQLAVSL